MLRCFAGSGFVQDFFDEGQANLLVRFGLFGIFVNRPPLEDLLHARNVLIEVEFLTLRVYVRRLGIA